MKLMTFTSTTAFIRLMLLIPLPLHRQATIHSNEVLPEAQALRTDRLQLKDISRHGITAGEMPRDFYVPAS